ncbi:hypothetical protein FKP32DRAFT_1612788 [Trametes sanguinea]|nr:hypothetical protein FKP32DRAFT_1612788 [Trametes sanguinea]
MRTTTALFSALLASLLGRTTHAQILGTDGLVYTNGLAIVNSPSPESTFQAGSVIPIAVDISGNGRLDANTTTAGSTKPTRIDSLEIYLVSLQAKLNLTVTSGSGLLTQEPNSAVKHLNFTVSTCIPAGPYNLTFYEAAHINNQSYFSITPLPVLVSNDHPTDACSNGTNTLQSVPQKSSPPPQSPWLNGSSVTTVAFATATGSTATVHAVRLASALVAPVFTLLLWL